MPLFDDLVPPRLLWPKTAGWPRRRARSLIGQFQSCFPELVYEMDLDVPVANAQALKINGVRSVRLYGGLVLHRKVRAPGFAVILAHETGHHLAGAPFHKAMRWLSSEERATEWALEEGLAHVFGKSRAKRIAQQGLVNLVAVRAA